MQSKEFPNIPIEPEHIAQTALVAQVLANYPLLQRKAVELLAPEMQRMHALLQKRNDNPKDITPVDEQEMSKLIGKVETTLRDLIESETSS